MALYHGGENDVEFVPSCSTSRDPSPTREDADLEGVLMGYPNISPALFTNLVAFKRICLARSKRLVEGTQTPQYLAFTSVSLLRLNVSASLLATGSARCGRRGRRSKEADVSYTPLSRPLEDDAWPSLVIEAGVSESLAMLRTDAAFWITNSDGRTRIMIVLSVNRRDRQILVERWEEDPRIRPNRSTANYSRIPRLIQSLTLNAGVTYVGLSFEIPAQKVFDNLPENIPRGEFLFTPDSLNEFNTIVWARAPQRQQHQQWACLYLQMAATVRLWEVKQKHTRKNFYDGLLVNIFGDIKTMLGPVYDFRLLLIMPGLFPWSSAKTICTLQVFPTVSGFVKCLW
jgi:hypothetical protein